MPLILKDTVEPMDGIMKQQDKVVAYWEKDCLGQGSLFLTEKNLVWLVETTKKGFVIFYPAISVHAASGSNEDFSEPCIFMMIDLSKTDIEYINEQEIGEDDASEDELRTATIRFVPAESSAIGEIFNILNKCQEMNPDPDDEQNSDGNFDDECMVGFGQNGRDEDSDDNEHSWFTQDNVTDEIHLSPEGRANLERILGNLGEGDQPFHQPNFEEDDQNEEMEH